MRRTPLTRRMAFTATKNASRHFFFSHFIGFFSKKTYPFIATGFFLPVAAYYYFEYQRKTVTTTTIYLDHDRICDELYVAVAPDDIESVKSLIAQGAILDINNHNYIELFTSILFNPKHTELLTILFSGQQHTDRLYNAVLQDDPDSISQCLKDNSTLFTRYQLEMVFMSATKNHRFYAIEVLFHHLRNRYQGIPALSKKNLEPEEQSSWEYNNDDLIFPANIPTEIRPALRNAFDQINCLFKSPELYLDFLKELNEAVRDLQSTTHFDFSTITPGESIPFNGFHLPSKPTAFTPHYEDKDDLLRSLIRKKLAKHDIDTQNTCYTFSGFVNIPAANEIVRSGSLFKEQFLMGNAILHGLHSHYLQWYILAIACEKNRIQFKEGITLRDVLTASVDVTKMNGDLAWQSIFDKANYNDIRTQRWYGGLPHRLNNILLFCSDLPHLRGLLLNSWYSSIAELQEIVELKYGQKPPYEIIGAQTILHAQFALFNLGITNVDVRRYCQNNHLGDLDMQTGIIHETKSTASNHRFFSLLDRSKASSAFETKIGTDSWMAERQGSNRK